MDLESNRHVNSNSVIADLALPETIRALKTAALVESGTGLQEAVALMEREGVDHLIVVEAGEVIGVTSLAEVFDRGVDRQLMTLHDDLTVDDLMTEIPGGMQATATLKETLEAMWRYDVAALPIVRDGRLLGVISQRDLLGALMQQMRADDESQSVTGLDESVDEDMTSAANRSKVMLSHPLMQNAMQILAEAGL